MMIVYPERHLPTLGQHGHSPQGHTAAGTAAPTTADTGNTMYVGRTLCMHTYLSIDVYMLLGSTCICAHGGWRFRRRDRGGWTTLDLSMLMYRGFRAIPVEKLAI